MARARKCDICRKYYDEYEFNGFGNTILFGVPTSGVKHSIVNTYDTCPDCMDAFITLIENKQIGDTEKNADR